jgi:Cu2+-exporting ATPase
VTIASRAPANQSSAGRAPCRHCGLPQPAPGHAPEGFCCSGCEAVYELLHTGGLDRFYDLGGGRGAPVGAVPEPQRRDWLAELVVAPTAGGDGAAAIGGSARATLDVQGIRCAACVWLIQELWRRRPGAQSIDLNPTRGRVRLEFDPALLDLDRFLDEVERLGYRFGPPSATSRRGEVDRGLLARLGICSALAMNAMTFAFAVHFGLAPEDGSLHTLFSGLSAVIATIAVIVGGPVFFRAAWGGLRQRALHLDLPISLGILLAWGGSLHAWLFGDGRASYFDTVTIFVALMLAGRFVQSRAIARNRDLVLENDGIEHLRARRVRDGRLELCKVAEIRAGDELVAAPGDLVPVDAELVDDRAADFSLDWIRGESEPRRFERGAIVPAGAFCGSDRAVRLRARADVHRSGLVELLTTPKAQDGGARKPDPATCALTEDGADCAPRQTGFWARLNRVYVALVLGLSASGALVWSFVDPSRALDVTISILVVTCPCALGIATPLAFELALGGLRRRGIYVRTQELVDKARRVRRVLLDKTGTLTWGGLRIEMLRRVPEGLRDVLATMVASSNHPVSRALLASVDKDRLARFLDPGELDVEEVPGQGLRATRTKHDGTTEQFLLGSRRFVLGDVDCDVDAVASGLVLFARDGHVEGCFSVDEDYRPGLREELDWMRGRGFDVHLLSGDRQEKVHRAAERLGVPLHNAHGELSPQDKAAIVRELDQDDTLMVGDGLNDAKAFDAAWCAGTPALDRAVMPARADFFYAGANGIASIRLVLEAARRFHAVVRTNLWLAALYNAGAVLLCFAGVMTPLLCAVLMPISSIALLAHTVAAFTERGSREVVSADPGADDLSVRARTA